MEADKIRENRLRKKAARSGLILQKSRRRDPDALDYGKFWLVDIPTKVVAFGGPGVTGGPDADLDEIEAYLSSDD